MGGADAVRWYTRRCIGHALPGGAASNRLCRGAMWRRVRSVLLSLRFPISGGSGGKHSAAVLTPFAPMFAKVGALTVAKFGYLLITSPRAPRALSIAAFRHRAYS